MRERYAYGELSLDHKAFVWYRFLSASTIHASYLKNEDDVYEEHDGNDDESFLMNSKRSCLILLKFFMYLQQFNMLLFRVL